MSLQYSTHMTENSHPNLTILDHPLIQDKMARLRDEQTTQRTFVASSDRLRD